MPEIDGFELCHKIRKDERTCHIRSFWSLRLGRVNTKLKDWATEPMTTSPNIRPGHLQTKLRIFCRSGNRLNKKYTSEMLLQPRNIILSSPDERFLQKAIEVVENKYSDSWSRHRAVCNGYPVSAGCNYTANLTPLTEMTVKEFVRNIRTKKELHNYWFRKNSMFKIALCGRV